jgi:hypothetical protein
VPYIGGPENLSKLSFVVQKAPFRFRSLTGLSRRYLARKKTETGIRVIGDGRSVISLRTKLPSLCCLKANGVAVTDFSRGIPRAMVTSLCSVKSNYVVVAADPSGSTPDAP